MLDALAAGKDVVTANKALLAEHGREVFAQARRYGRAVAFEASVGGGIPIVQALEVGLAANQVTALAAIVNGTCNFILTKMTQEGLPYATALAAGPGARLRRGRPDARRRRDRHRAQARRARPARLRRDRDDRPDPPPRGSTGSSRRTSPMRASSATSSSSWRWPSGGARALELRVAPTLVKQGTPLAEVRGPYNAVRVVGDAVGDTLFYGRGAGAMPTASAVVGDLIDVVVGRAALTFRALNLWPDDVPDARLASPSAIRSRYYLRFSIADRPGAIAVLAQVLGSRGISIASVIQHDPGDDAPDGIVPLVIMTHLAVESDVTAALDAIDRPRCRPPAERLPGRRGVTVQSRAAGRFPVLRRAAGGVGTESLARRSSSLSSASGSRITGSPVLSPALISTEAPSVRPG